MLVARGFASAAALHQWLEARQVERDQVVSLAATGNELVLLADLNMAQWQDESNVRTMPETEITEHEER